MLCSLMLALLRLAAGAEECAGVEFLEGHVTHARSHEANHAFKYPVRMALVDLDSPPAWWSQEPVPRLSAKEVREALGVPSGRVRVLTTPSSAGYHQNPIQIYFCDNKTAQGQGICEGGAFEAAGIHACQRLACGLADFSCAMRSWTGESRLPDGRPDFSLAVFCNLGFWDVRNGPQCMLNRLHDHAADLGGKCLASGYKNNKTKVRWQCQHGHTWDAKPDNVLNKKSWCPECARNRRRIPLQRLKDHASAKGGRCLSTSKHSSCRTKVLWECRLGHTWKATPDGVLYKGTWCPKCSLKGRSYKKRSLKDLQEHAASLGGRCLATAYEGVMAPVVWQCHKRHTWQAIPHSVLNRQTWCPACAGNALLDLHLLQEHATRRGGKCLATDYVNSKTKVAWKCEHGHTWRATPQAILNQGQWCPHCKKIGLPRLRAHAASLGGRCLARSYQNSREKIFWECKEGHRWNATANAVLNQNTWCPRCAARTWRTEAEIRSILESIFHPVGFPSCYPSFLEGLQLDGYCPDLLLAFEYQGEQHYDPENYFHFGDPSSFHSQRERDARKVELCKDAGVRLLIIPCFVNDKRTFVLTALLQWFAWDQITPTSLVTNTPWNHHVFFAFDRTGAELPKPLHVSPLMDLQHRWQIQTSDPSADPLEVSVDVLPGPEAGAKASPIFRAHLRLQRSQLPHARAERAGSFRMLWDYGFQPQRTSVRIYLNAVKLMRKGVGFRSHPKPAYKEAVLGAQQSFQGRGAQEPWWRDNEGFPWGARWSPDTKKAA
ncbi:unnamed protein product [Symbiodinium microadriaticum]|nr:unnamed protein product [Symbiodinium microadriaticum]